LELIFNMPVFVVLFASFVRSALSVLYSIRGTVSASTSGGIGHGHVLLALVTVMSCY
jgi:hypothetical protein